MPPIPPPLPYDVAQGADNQYSRPAVRLFDLILKDLLGRGAERLEIRREGNSGVILTGTGEELTRTAVIPEEAFRLILSRLKVFLGSGPDDPFPTSGTLRVASGLLRAELAVAVSGTQDPEMASFTVTYLSDANGEPHP